MWPRSGSVWPLVAHAGDAYLDWAATMAGVAVLPEPGCSAGELAVGDAGAATFRSQVPVLCPAQACLL